MAKGSVYVSLENKLNLTIPEAAAHSNMGQNKIESCSKRLIVLLPCLLNKKADEAQRV